MDRRKLSFLLADPFDVFFTLKEELTLEKEGIRFSKEKDSFLVPLEVVVLPVEPFVLGLVPKIEIGSNRESDESDLWVDSSLRGINVSPLSSFGPFASWLSLRVKTVL